MDKRSAADASAISISPRGTVPPMTGRIVMTGAAGGVAGMVRPYLERAVDQLVLTDRDEVPGGVRCELTNRPALRKVLAGARSVIHLGGQPVEADWETVRECNVEGAISLFECAKLEGIERIVFASSLHAVGYMPAELPFGPSDVIRPDSLYGVSKVFGESLCMLYADKHGMRTFAIRIGTVLPQPADRRTLSTWIHPEDLTRLMLIGLEDPRVHAEIVYGVSNPMHRYFDNSRAHELGYRPKHRSADFAEQHDCPEPPYPYVGGTFAELSASADGGRTLSATRKSSLRASRQQE